MKRSIIKLGLSYGALLMAGSVFADVVDFDFVSAPPDFASKLSQDIIVTPAVTISGGVILNDLDFGGGATTKPNLYATADGSIASYLSGVISGTFSTPVTSLGMDIINGFSPADFTLTGFDVAGNEVATITLASYLSVGSIGHVAIAGPSIASFDVTTSQETGSKDFAIDTVVFNGGSVPDFASTFGLLSMALFGLTCYRHRKI